MTWATRSIAEQAGALMGIRRYGEALAAAQAAAAADPESLSARCLISQAYLGLRRFDDALAAAHAALALGGDHEWPHRLCSVALRKLGLPREAVASAGTAATLAPESPEAMQALLDAQREAGYLAEAVMTAERALRLAPDSSCIHVSAGMTFLRTGNPQLAESHFRRAIALDPTQPMAFNNLGVALLRRRKRSAALSALRTAAELDPTDVLALSNIHALIRSDHSVRRWRLTPLMMVPVLLAYNAVRTSIPPRSYRDLPPALQAELFPPRFHLYNVAVLSAMCALGGLLLGTSLAQWPGVDGQPLSMAIPVAGVCILVPSMILLGMAGRRLTLAIRSARGKATPRL